ncbi:MAG: sigma-70 family RNA polymerase sigma factor [Methylococcaceae bacterium]|nr:sigma-70 family RNA polymerase sigma factor [Methylococcaceae bacterium]
MKEKSSMEPENWLSDYGDLLYRYAFSRVRSEAVAEDLLQETLLAAIQGVGKFNGKSSVSSWLVGILKHKIMDYYRKSQREMPLLTDADLGEDLMSHQFDAQGNWQVDLADWLTPEASLDNEEFWKVYYQCQSRLSDTMARLFMLRVVDGVSTEDCCQILGFKTDNQLWVALSRTRMKLRQCLETHWFNQEEDRC